jgi:hypothetical protein
MSALWRLGRCRLVAEFCRWHQLLLPIKHAQPDQGNRDIHAAIRGIGSAGGVCIVNIDAMVSQGGADYVCA